MATMNDSLVDSPRFHGFQRSIPYRASKANLGPFRATQIWNEIIEHLKTKVEVKRRRLKMRNHDNCFTGADAVDTVLTYLLSDRNTFSSDLSREKAIKLCQSLMDRSVFSPVSSRASEIKKTFEDSHSKFYRFVGMEPERDTVTILESESDDDQNFSVVEDGRCKEDDMRINPDLEPDLLDDSVICNPIAVNKKGQVLQEIMSLHSSFSLPHRRRSRSSLKSANASMLMRSMKEKHNVSPEALEDLWKEVALCQLLTIVDLPFLDGLLSEDKSKKNVKQTLIISNVVAKHWNLPMSGSNRIQDPVMSTALDCIECLPKGILVLENSFVRETTPAAKIQAFNVISEHYSENHEESLLPERFLDLHLAILNLVLQQCDSKALVALQLDMILLPWHVREELQRLLLFMSAISDKECFQIDHKDDNETVMLNTFTDAIFRHKVVAHKLARVLVNFMVKNVDTVFKVPSRIRERVNSRIDELKTGEVSPVRDYVYCSQVSLAEYEQQTKECTEKALVQLFNSILDDTSIPLKEKKNKLRQFQKHHPDIYVQHFAEIN